MTSAELKKRLIEAIAGVENPVILKALYNRLLSAVQEELNREDVSAIEEAGVPYGTGESSPGEEADREREEEYISGLVESGEYQNYTEVIQDALNLHKRYREKKIEELRKEIDLGWNGPDSSMSMEEIIKSFRNAE